MTPTAEQTAIVDAAHGSKENLRLIAYAGAAKTTTLELITKRVTGVPTLSLAFNKRIAEEMSKRLGGHVECKTLNALGHGVWQRATSRRLTLNTEKTKQHLRAAIEKMPKAAQWEYKEIFVEVMKMISQAKIQGYIPEGTWTHAKPLTTRQAFTDSFEETPSEGIMRLVDSVLSSIIRASFDGEIDFDDQLYMPTLFGGTWPKFPLVLIDEAQDLSPLNHAMLRKLVSQRVICVGDPYQSIYGFRGAVHAGMDHLQTTFDMSDMKLSTSFRCPQNIIRRAWFRVPDMRWPDWAREGKVEQLDAWGPNSIPDNSAIICRNNAPLLSLAFKLIAAGRGVKLVGMDIGPGLIKTMNKLGPESMSAGEVHNAIDRWEQDQMKRSRVPASTHDKAECFRIFADQGNTLGAALAWAKQIFAQSGPIQLLSGHKSKGLEWDTVFHLDPHRIPSPYCRTDEEREQELNVRYVIETRAKETLFLVRSDEFRS